MEAVQAFLKESDAFVIDESREKYLLSFNRQGFLKKRD
jgi:cephalosporin hydroxylase